MHTVIANLLKAVKHALHLLGQFISILFLGLLAALLYALPWLLRMVCVLGWLIGGCMAMDAIQKLYGSHSPARAVLVLQFAAIFLMVAWAGTLLLINPKYIWGGLALGGLLSAWVTWQGIPWLFAQWVDADLFFRILPAALFSLALIYLTIRLRFLRKHQQLHLTKPGLSWLPKLRGHHERNEPNE
jgi:hypothetical protein